MNTDHFKQILEARERDLVARLGAEIGSARTPRDEAAGDAGDQSVSDDSKDESVREADADSSVLNQVRDALRRIEDGTYGQCVVDGGPIEPARLEAVPWTPYCLKHQTAREGTFRPATL